MKEDEFLITIIVYIFFAIRHNIKLSLRNFNAVLSLSDGKGTRGN